MKKQKQTKTKKNTSPANIIFILDKSGSMQRIKTDTIGGFNSFLTEQKKLNLPTKFWLTLFDTVSIEHRYEGVDIDKVEELNDNNYIPSGATPLYDAVGTTIRKLDDVKEALIVILTDGEENASKEYTNESVKKLIEEKEKNGYKFLYLGIGIDNYVKNASAMGINSAVMTSLGNMSGSYNALNTMTATYRSCVSDNTTSAFDTSNTYNAALKHEDNKK